MCAWSVSEFRALIRDFNRKHLFMCNIIFPVAIGGTSDYINIMAESGNLPGKKIDAVDVDFAGLPYKVAGKVSYPDWKVTFRIDDNLDVYKQFRAWSELIIGSESNLATFPAVYQSNPEMYQLDPNGNKLARITLINAWPNEIGDISYDTKDRTLATVDITWSFNYPKYEVL